MPDTTTTPLGGLSPAELAGLLASLGGLAGAFPTSSSSTTTGSQAQTGTSVTNVDMATLLNTILNTAGTSTQAGLSTPVLSPEAQALQTQLAGKYSSLTAPSLTGYGAGQTANINQAADAQGKALSNIMAARGLATSPAAATAQAGVQQNRLNQITGMQQQLPLLKNQMNLQNLGAASAFFSAMPKGTATTGTGTTTGTQTGTQTGSQTGTQNFASAMQGSATGASAAQGGGGLGGAFGGGAAGFAAIIPYLIQLAKASQPNQNTGGGGSSSSPPPIINFGGGGFGGGGGF